VDEQQEAPAAAGRGGGDGLGGGHGHHPPRPDALVDAGLPRHAAEAVAELYRADDRGLLTPRGDRVEHGTTPLAETVARLAGTPAGV
jgi:hypothetical protein